MKSLRENRILIAEDDEVSGSLLQNALTAGRTEVFLVRNGVDALNVLDRSPLDVLITDIDLPGKDGVALITEIRRREALKNAPRPLPIIAMSGGGDDELSKAVRAGATCAFAKPIDLKLIDWLLKLLEGGAFYRSVPTEAVAQGML